MEKLKMKYERMEKGKKEVAFESEDFNTCLNWTITALFDGNVKRCKIKIDQYYVDGKEYCKIQATYKRNYEETKDVYTIYNWCNEWGNFINVYKTFENNGKKI